MVSSNTAADERVIARDLLRMARRARGIDGRRLIQAIIYERQANGEPPSSAVWQCAAIIYSWHRFGDPVPGAR